MGLPFALHRTMTHLEGDKCQMQVPHYGLKNSVVFLFFFIRSHIQQCSVAISSWCSGIAQVVLGMDGS